MDGMRFCGLSEALETQELRRNPHASWWVEVGLNTVSRDAIRGVVSQAMAAWGTVAAITASEAVSEDVADLIVRVAQIDGPLNVLADTMLPGPPQQLMRLDESEAWTVHIGSDVADNLIDLYRVMAHELGHYWGLGHDRPGSLSLMAPTYSRNIWTPQPWDISQIVGLYGRSQAPPPPNPNPEGRVPSSMDIFDQHGGKMASYQIRRVA